MPWNVLQVFLWFIFLHTPHTSKHHFWEVSCFLNKFVMLSCSHGVEHISLEQTQVKHSQLGCKMTRNTSGCTVTLHSIELAAECGQYFTHYGSTFHCQHECYAYVLWHFCCIQPLSKRHQNSTYFSWKSTAVSHLTHLWSESHLVVSFWTKGQYQLFL